MAEALESAVKEQLTERRNWNFVAVLVWHSVGYFLVVSALCFARVFSAALTPLQVLILNIVLGTVSTFKARVCVAGSPQLGLTCRGSAGDSVFPALRCTASCSAARAGASLGCVRGRVRADTRATSERCCCRLCAASRRPLARAKSAPRLRPRTQAESCRGCAPRTRRAHTAAEVRARSLQWQQDVLNWVKLLCVSVGVGAASYALCTQLRLNSVTVRVASLFPVRFLTRSRQADVASVVGSCAGLVHVAWMYFCDGCCAPFPPLPRPRLYRVKSCAVHGAGCVRAPTRDANAG